MRTELNICIPSTQTPAPWSPVKMSEVKAPGSLLMDFYSVFREAPTSILLSIRNPHFQIKQTQHASTY